MILQLAVAHCVDTVLRSMEWDFRRLAGLRTKLSLPLYNSEFLAFDDIFDVGLVCSAPYHPITLLSL